MAEFSLDELRRAYEHHAQVSDDCAASCDYNAMADLYTEDCTYVEHVFGEMRGREAVREWLVPLMVEWPNNLMTYTHDWVIFDESSGCVVFCARSHLPDLGDGNDYSATNWTRLDYAGDGLFWRAEDIYNPASFATLITNWQAAEKAANT
jgi:ketosteroid isomerase-like protein